jgi:hypothetical protein
LPAALTSIDNPFEDEIPSPLRCLPLVDPTWLEPVIVRYQTELHSCFIFVTPPSFRRETENDIFYSRLELVAEGLLVKEYPGISALIVEPVLDGLD